MIANNLKLMPTPLFFSYVNRRSKVQQTAEDGSQVQYELCKLIKWV